MQMPDEETLKSWLQKTLDELGADNTELLIQYVLALLTNNTLSADELREKCLKQLTDFLNQDTEFFVDKLFMFLENGSSGTQQQENSTGEGEGAQAQQGQQEAWPDDGYEDDYGYEYNEEYGGGSGQRQAHNWEDNDDFYQAQRGELDGREEGGEKREHTDEQVEDSSTERDDGARAKRVKGEAETWNVGARAQQGQGGGNANTRVTLVAVGSANFDEWQGMEDLAMDSMGMPTDVTPQQQWGNQGPPNNWHGNWQQQQQPPQPPRGNFGGPGPNWGPGPRAPVPPPVPTRQRCFDYYERGMCTRGLDCPFDHGENAQLVEGDVGKGGPRPTNPNTVITITPKDNHPAESRSPAPRRSPQPGGFENREQPRQPPHPSNVSNFGNRPAIPPQQRPMAQAQRPVVPPGKGPGIGASTGETGPQVRGPVDVMPGDVMLELKCVPIDLNDSQKIHAYFAKYGTITSVVARFNSRPDAARITYTTCEEAKRAYEDQSLVMGSPLIKLFFVRKGRRNRPPQPPAPLGQRPRFESRPAPPTMQNRPMQQQQQQPARPAVTNKQAGSSVHVPMSQQGSMASTRSDPSVEDHKRRAEMHLQKQEAAKQQSLESLREAQRHREELIAEQKGLIEKLEKNKATLSPAERQDIMKRFKELSLKISACPKPAAAPAKSKAEQLKQQLLAKQAALQQQQKQPGVGNIAVTSKIYVSGVSLADSPGLMHHFGRYGRLAASNPIVAHNKGVVVHFDERNAAKKALEEGASYQGRSLQMTWYVPVDSKGDRRESMDGGEIYDPMDDGDDWVQ